MARLQREKVIEEALALLAETGLDGVTTRRLAERLGVESASLYWHFKNKAELLNEMASAVLKRHHRVEVSEDPANWRKWMIANFRSLRSALLSHRNGAMLHAGTTPVARDIETYLGKLDFLIRAGFTKKDAAMALYSLGQYTIGCVLEEQARSGEKPSRRKKISAPDTDEMAPIEAEKAFEYGIQIFIEGLASRLR